MVTLREALRSDVPEILNIINHEILHGTSVYDYTERTLAIQYQWFDDKKEHKYPILVSVKDGKVVGFATYGMFRPWEAYKSTVEHSVYVKEGNRGAKIGEQLIIALIKKAKDQGYHVMIGGIDASNQQSYDFHAKFGFKETGRLPKVAYKFNRWLDLVFMQLMLK